MKTLLSLLQLTLPLLLILSCNYAEADEKKTYIVHMDKTHMPQEFNHPSNWYSSALKSVSDSTEMMYTYDMVLHGFSTRLTAQEAQLLEKHPGILSVQPEQRYELHTTRSPEFLGLETVESLSPDVSEKAGQVIVGVLDTGAWPELESYNDAGLGDIPKDWKGECEVSTTFNLSSCNKKLIGARFFSKGYEAAFGPIDESQESRSPRDDDGHGTHTSTTAAGSAVQGANLFGFASGTARGMASKARIATYKVCWLGGCFGSDLIAAIDKAVLDGVNVISMSIGGSSPEYYKDNVAIGAFSAVAQGILVSCSAGNGGPGEGTLSNVAPWITTVGAGTLDRDFPAYVSLGNEKNYTGTSLYSGKEASDSLIPIVYAGNVTNSTAGFLCLTGSLIPKKVAGKIVLCDRGVNSRAQKGLEVKSSGGAGMILANTDLYGEELVADAHLLPSAAVGQKSGDAIKQYIFSELKPSAKITSGVTELGVQPSPVVAAFSSRGPNPLTPEILKPDLIAPGVNILAGWSKAAGPTSLAGDKRRVSFNIISGTSMSCPHISGLAALVKASHLDWSPAAIKSALMTTSYGTYKNGETLQDVASGKSATPFDFGAGHVDPVRALDPGLVYDTSVEDYLGFLCALNYSSRQIQIVTRKDNFTCDTSKQYSIGDLNYPSFAVPFQTASGKGGGGEGGSTTLKYTRILTNVGPPGTYKVTLSSPSSVKISVEPETLSFRTAYEKKSYTVTFVAASKPSGTTSFARLEWSDGKHVVGSPIAFSWT